MRQSGEPRVGALWVRAPPPKSQRSEGARSTDAEADARGGAAPAAADASAVASPLVSFVDQSVYSRNRCFRLFKSSKVGKRAQLRPCQAQLMTLRPVLRKRVEGVCVSPG